MPRKCVVTGRKTTTGNARSHAMNANKRTWVLSSKSSYSCKW